VRERIGCTLLVIVARRGKNRHGVVVSSRTAKSKRAPFCFRFEAFGREIVRPHAKILLRRNSSGGNLGHPRYSDVVYRPLDTPMTAFRNNHNQVLPC
jgi:hypothetical protein